MLRKQIIGSREEPPTTTGGEIDIAAVATVMVTSEDPEHPIDHAFDQSRGPGGSRWIAGEPGEQTVILAFDAPQAIRRVVLEIEEPGVARTQELQLAVSADGGQTYREVLRQEYNFSPSGSTFEREDWSVPAEGVTHLRLVIRPDKGGRPCRGARAPRPDSGCGRRRPHPRGPALHGPGGYADSGGCITICSKVAWMILEASSASRFGTRASCHSDFAKNFRIVSTRSSAL